MEFLSVIQLFIISSFIFNDISVLALFNSFLAINWEWATLALNIILSSVLTFVHVSLLCRRPLILSKHRQFCYFFTIYVIWPSNLSTLALASNIVKQRFTTFDITGYFSSLFWTSISIILDQYLSIGMSYQICLYTNPLELHIEPKMSTLSLKYPIVYVLYLMQEEIFEHISLFFFHFQYFCNLDLKNVN